MKHFVRHIILFLMIATVTSCYDEFMKQEFIGEGKAKISATIDFKPMSAALTRTKTAGDALKDIKSLHVLLYNEKSELIKKWKIESYKESDENRTDADAENNHKAEETNRPLSTCRKKSTSAGITCMPWQTLTVYLRNIPMTY